MVLLRSSSSHFVTCDFSTSTHIYFFSVEVDIAVVEAFVIVNRIRVTHARLLHLSCQQRVFDFQEHLCIIKITRITYARRRPLYSQQRVTKRTRNDR